MCTQKTDSLFPVIGQEEEVEEQWLSVAEAAEYGDMSSARVYNAIDKGLKSRINPVSNIKEVPKEALEMWFCPFKKNSQYLDQQVADELSKQQSRIRHLRSRIDILRGHIEDLQSINNRLLSELDLAHEKENKLIKIIENMQKT